MATFTGEVKCNAGGCCDLDVSELNMDATVGTNDCAAPIVISKGGLGGGGAAAATN